MATDGPAHAAGVRSGDVVVGIGWTRLTSAAAFDRELARRDGQGAVVLDLRADNTPSLFGGTLVRFAAGPPTRFQRLAREAAPAAPPGWTVLSQNPIATETLVVRETGWCSRVVHAELRKELLFADRLAMPDDWPAAAQTVRARCPQLQELRLTIYSVPHGSPVNVLVVDFGGGRADGRLEGLDGMRRGANLIETREIAASDAPACDRLAAHPADRHRRYGVGGVAYILDPNVARAIDACLAATARAPADVVANYQLGRALHRAALYQEALPHIEIAAAAGHGAALDLLGDMYRAGEGVVADADHAEALAVRARAAGFVPEVIGRSAWLDATAATLPDILVRFHHGVIDTRDRREVELHAGYLSGVLSGIDAGCRDIVAPGYLSTLLPVIRAQLQTRGISPGSESERADGYALLARQDCDSSRILHFVLMASELLLDHAGR